MSGNIHEIASPPTDAISSVRFSPDSNTLLIGSWDSAIHIYARDGGSFTFQSKIDCDAPVLDLAWNSNGTTFYAAGLDHEVAQYTDGNRQVLSTHRQACNKVAFSAQHNLVLSTSWDSTLHVHDANTGVYVPLKLAEKPFALSLTQGRAVVAMADRNIQVYDLMALKMLVEQAGSKEDGRLPIESQPWQKRTSSLKFMTRDIACMPDGTGFAASSIEGRVGVEWFDAEANEQTYAFKCHREKTTLPGGEAGDAKPVDIIFPVNALVFHPLHGSFATGGGDGVVALWDAKTKRRIRQYPKLPASVAALDFSADGKMLAIGISPGFEDGKEEQEPDPELLKIYIRELGDNEAKGKAEKSKKDGTAA